MCYLVTFLTSGSFSTPETFSKEADARSRAEKLVMSPSISDVRVWKFVAEARVNQTVAWKGPDNA